MNSGPSSYGSGSTTLLPSILYSIRKQIKAPNGLWIAYAKECLGKSLLETIQGKRKINLKFFKHNF
jgi:hypothetical protein